MRAPADRARRGFAKFALAEFDDVPRARFVGHLELVARFGSALQAENFDRRRGPRAFHRAAVIVKHRANLAVDRAANENVSGIQRSRLHQDRRHRAAAPVHAGFQHGARAGRFRIGFQFAQVGDEQKHFEQLVQILFLLRGDFHHHGVSAPFLGHQAALGKLALDALGLRARLVDFVDGHDDGHARGFGVVDGFLRLRHHAVIGRDDQHDDVRDFRAARAHARERFVARRVDEHDLAAVDVNLRRADVLRDSSGLSRGDFRFADRVEQAGFAVIDVAHHSHHGRARHKIFRLFFLGDFRTTSSSNVMHVDDAVERFRKARRCRRVERLVDAGEDPAIQQNFQDFLGAHIELFRQIADRHSFGDRNFARLARRRRGSALNLRAAPLLADAHAGADRMQLALAFFKALLHRGARAGGRLAFVNRLAGLSLWRRLVRRQKRSGAAARTGRTRALMHRLAGSSRHRLPRTALSRARRKSGLAGRPAARWP